LTIKVLKVIKQRVTEVNVTVTSSENENKENNLSGGKES
jgi:hypothetical protein